MSPFFCCFNILSFSKSKFSSSSNNLNMLPIFFCSDLLVGAKIEKFFMSSLFIAVKVLPWATLFHLFSAKSKD